MTIIASKLPPKRYPRTFFSSGRAAFAFLVGEVIRPRRVWLPTFSCWSLVSTMQRRFRDIELEFYAVDRTLTCHYPAHLSSDELLVFVHFFGHENREPLPGGGKIAEDLSHAFLSRIEGRADYSFGSLRKLLNIGDGGFVDGFFNPIYEPSRKLDTWLRYEAEDWRDLREAENMLDRAWPISDISSQSLAVLLTCDEDGERARRTENERFLFENMTVGRPICEFRHGECPLLHQRLFDSMEERDSIRRHLASRGIFTSIHWPAHPLVREIGPGAEEAEWLETHSLSIPVGSSYSLEHMRRIVAESERHGS